MKKLINNDWEFALLPSGSTFEDIDGSVTFAPVNIPHDWLIYDTNNLYASGLGAYRRTLNIKDPSRAYSLIFDGVYMDSAVYVNGQKVMEWKNGYTSFVAPLSGYIKAGDNALTVTVNYKEPNTRWYSGAGIFRDVYLEDKNPVHIAHNGIYISAVPKDRANLGGDWELSVSVEVIDETLSDDPVMLTVKNMVEDETGAAVCSFEGEVSPSPAGTVPYERYSVAPASFASVFEYTGTVSGPKLWSPDSCALYRLRTFIYHGDELLDCAENTFGFRLIEADPDKGFFLNGKHIKLNGACMHHDLGALGAAFNLTALERQFRSLKAMGVNAVRTSHNPPAQRLLELADRTGMLIDCEFTDMWARTKTANDYGNYFNDWCERDVASWIRRDRNHPSVIMWSIGNEIYDTFFEEEGIPITKRLSGLVRFHDPRRNAFTTIGSNYIECESAQKCAEFLDASGYNYAERLYEKHHADHPDWVIYGSETSSTVQSRGIYHFPASKRLLTHDDNQCSSLGNCSTNWGAKDTATVIINDRDAKFSLGQFIWTGWDYIGEPTPYFTKNSYFGQVDTAGFNKDTYYLYQAEWTDCKKSPMVHILPYWDFNPGQMIDVKVYSNAPVSELFFNGRSLGRFRHDHVNGRVLNGTWSIPYEKGVLKACAYDEEGTLLAEDTCSSFGDTEKLLLIPDREQMTADGEDLIFVEIKAVDAKGEFVANARNRAFVSISGPGRLVGLDNGDSTDFEQYKCSSRRLFSGRLLAIVAATKEAGVITLKVSSPGLSDSVVTLEAKEGHGRDGISCLPEVCFSYGTAKDPGNSRIDDLPVRKIELIADEGFELTKEKPAVRIGARIYPANAIVNGLEWKALDSNGVEANFVRLTPDPGTQSVLAEAFGDGEFSLRCSAYNGTDYPAVFSEYSFKAEGFGLASLDPYGFVYASLRSEETGGVPVTLSFKGGVMTQDKESCLYFDRVDFGDFGSDEITVPLFHWENVIPLEIWEGHPQKGGTLLFKGNYEHPSVYNQYNSNTFKLSKKLKGITSLSIVTFSRISVQGFFFTKPEKAFEKLYAADCSNVNGDSFTQGPKAITGIGNNVTIEFRDMDFGEKGCRRITICGRTPNTANAIHLFFDGPKGQIKQMIAFNKAEVCVEQTFELEPVYGPCNLSFVFLPGSDFDLEWFRFD